MMCKIVEHFITGLQQDCEHLKEQRDLSVFDSEARKKKEVKLYQQLSELIETERKYVQDLEQVSTRGGGFNQELSSFFSGLRRLFSAA